MSPSPLHRHCALLGILSALLYERAPFRGACSGAHAGVYRCSRMAEPSHLACRRITNRESARRMRLKRQEEWAAIKRQVRCYSLLISPALWECTKASSPCQ